jgi:hypothetical protein
MIAKVIIIDSSKNTIDISSFVEEITWSGDINTFSRTLEVKMANARNIKASNIFNYDLGNIALMYDIKGNELFRGYIFKRSLDNEGSDSFTAYDQLVYLSKNSYTMLVKDMTASNVVNSLFTKFNIPIGYIEPTTYKIDKQVFTNSDLGQIINDCLTTTTAITGKGYILFSKQGKAYMYSRQNSAKQTITTDNVFTANRDISIENMRTQVMVEKGSIDSTDDKYSTYTSKDQTSVNKYGLMQHIESIDSSSTTAQMQSLANSKLSELNRKDDVTSIDFLGDFSCITGNQLHVYEPHTMTSGLYYITNDSHSISQGLHKMTLQLSSDINVISNN